jgi:hypothetical protein
VNGPDTTTAFVLSQTPQAGARVAQGTAISLTTTDLAGGGSGGGGGISKVTLYNFTPDMHAVNVWLFDASTGRMTGGASIASGANTDVSLSSASLYTIFAIDPALCGGTNDPTNVSCERWQQTVIGDPNGSPLTASIF